MKQTRNTLFLTIILILNSLIGIGQPKIRFENMRYDFGQVVEGTKVVHNFIFSNIGNQPLIISHVKASCGCTTPSYTRQAVLPGQTGTITVIYDSKNRLGVFNKSIAITSNTPGTVLTIFIKGLVKNREDIRKTNTKEIPIIQLQEEKKNIGKTLINDNNIFEIAIENKGGAPLIIHGVNAACNCVSLDATATTTIAAQSKIMLRIVINANKLGTGKFNIKIHSNDFNKPISSISIETEVTKHLETPSPMKINPSSNPFK